MPRGVSVYDEAKLQGRLWTPMSDPERVLAYWDFADVSSIDFVSGDAATVRDQMGRYDLSQSTASRRPAYGTCGIYPCLNFDEDSLANTSFTGLTGSQKMVFAVGSMASASDAYARFVSMTLGGNADYNASSRSATILRAGTDDAIATQSKQPSGSVAIVTDTPYIMTAVYTGTQYGACVNGGDPVLSARVTSWNIDRISLGSRASDAKAFLDGSIGGVIVCNTYDAHLRQLIEGYLAWRWKDWDLVDKLASQSPFKNRPPMIGD